MAIATRLGCYVDSWDRDLSGDETSSGSMTIELCLETCRSKGYTYAGVQSNSQCFCGNSYGKHGIDTISSCSTACTGNNLQVCGGSWRNMVYAVGKSLLSCLLKIFPSGHGSATWC